MIVLGLVVKGVLKRTLMVYNAFLNMTTLTYTEAGALHKFNMYITSEGAFGIQKKGAYL